jgi:hypothetical protein
MAAHENVSRETGRSGNTAAASAPRKVYRSVLCGTPLLDSSLGNDRPQYPAGVIAGASSEVKLLGGSRPLTAACGRSIPGTSRPNTTEPNKRNIGTTVERIL